MWAEMVQQVKVPTTKSDNLGQTPKLHMVEGQTPASCPLIFIHQM